MSRLGSFFVRILEAAGFRPRKLIRVVDFVGETPGNRRGFPDYLSCATDFRDGVLIPKLCLHKYLEVDLDGTRGYPSCWLREEFGGLRLHFSAEEIRRRIRLRGWSESLKAEIWRYVQEN